MSTLRTDIRVPHRTSVNGLHDLLLYPPRLIPITPIVIALDLLHDRLHLLHLPLPLLLAHLRLAAEELLVGLAVGAAETVPERRELAVVVVEVEVVHGVAGGAVDEGGVGYVFAIICWGSGYQYCSGRAEGGRCLRMKTVQTLMKAKRAMYANFWRGKRNGKTW